MARPNADGEFNTRPDNVRLSVDFRVKGSIVSQGQSFNQMVGVGKTHFRLFTTTHDSCSWACSAAGADDVIQVSYDMHVLPKDSDDSLTGLSAHHVTDTLKFHGFVKIPSRVDPVAASLVGTGESYRAISGPSGNPVLLAPRRKARELAFVASGYAPLVDVMAAACGRYKTKAAGGVVGENPLVIQFAHNFNPLGVVLEVLPYGPHDGRYKGACASFETCMRLLGLSEPSVPRLIARCPLNDSKKFNDLICAQTAHISKSIKGRVHKFDDSGDHMFLEPSTCYPMYQQGTNFAFMNRDFSRAVHMKETKVLTLYFKVLKACALDVSDIVTCQRNLRPDQFTCLLSEFEKSPPAHLLDKNGEITWDLAGYPWFELQHHFALCDEHTLCSRASPYVSDVTVAAFAVPEEPGAGGPDAKEARGNREVGAPAHAVSARERLAVNELFQEGSVATQCTLASHVQRKRRGKKKGQCRGVGEQACFRGENAGGSVVDRFHAAGVAPSETVLDDSEAYNALTESERRFVHGSLIPLLVMTERVSRAGSHPHELGAGYFNLDDCEGKAGLERMLVNGIRNVGSYIDKNMRPDDGVEPTALGGLDHDKMVRYAREYDSPLLDMTIQQKVNFLHGIHMIHRRLESGEYYDPAVLGTANGASADHQTTEVGGHAWKTLLTTHPDKIRERLRRARGGEQMGSQLSNPLQPLDSSGKWELSNRYESCILCEGTAPVSQLPAYAVRELVALGIELELTDIPTERRDELIKSEFRPVDGSPNSNMVKHLTPVQTAQLIEMSPFFEPVFQSLVEPGATVRGGILACDNPRMRVCMPYVPELRTELGKEAAPSGFYRKAYLLGETFLFEVVKDPASGRSVMRLGVPYDGFIHRKTYEVPVSGEPSSAAEAEELKDWCALREEVIHPPPVLHGMKEKLLERVWHAVRVVNSGCNAPITKTVTLISSEAADDAAQRQALAENTGMMCNRMNAEYALKEVGHRAYSFNAMCSTVKGVTSVVKDLPSHMVIQAAPN